VQQQKRLKRDAVAEAAGASVDASAAGAAPPILTPSAAGAAPPAPSAAAVAAGSGEADMRSNREGAVQRQYFM
jgi:hypothetical protein